MCLKKYSVTAFFFLACFFLKAQEQTLLFNHLNVNNGLSQGVNNCVYKDSRGYIWISSFDGLNKFDGLDCTIFRENPDNKNSILGTLFLNILEDNESNLWIGSNKGINFYNRSTNSFLNYQIPGRKENEQIISPFYIDDKKRIWLQSGSDIFRFDINKKQFKLLYHFTIPGNLFIKTQPVTPFEKLQQLYAVVDKTPRIYAGRPEQDTIHWSTLFSTATAEYKSFNCILPLQSGLWIGTNRGLLYYSNSQPAFNIHSFNNTEIADIQTLCTDKKGMLWAGSLQQGLFAADTAAKKIIAQYSASSRNPYSLSGNQVQYLFTDAENHLWASVWGKGVDYVSLDKFRFQHHLTKEAAEELHYNNFIRSIIQVDDTHFWCGTQSGILILDSKKNVSGTITAGLPPAIEHLFKDKNGIVWAATFSGLFMIDAVTKKVRPFIAANNNYSAPGNQFNFITAMANGNLLASSNAGLFCIKNSNGQYHINQVKGLPKDDVYLTSFADNNGTVYISRAYKGFTTGTIENDSFLIKKDFSYQATIKCFTETDNTYLFIGSTSGLMRFNKKTAAVEKIYTTANGLSNQYIYGVLPDSNSLWLSTNAGINRLQLSNEYIKHFTAGDGLQSNEFNTYSFCKAADGELLFGGVNGLNSFYPSAISAYPYSPKLQLSGLQINDGPPALIQNPGELKSLVLQPDENTVSFQFTVLDFANPGANTLFYTLEGYDKKWIAAANKSVIRYANLPPGNYMLKARGINSENVESTVVYTLSVTVKTPWWKSWWFSTLLIISIIGIVFLLIKNYLARQLQKQKIIMEKELAIEQERTRMSRELHDGLGSMLSGIKHSFSAMKNQLELDDKQGLRFNNNIDKLNESIKELRNLSHSMASDSLLKYGLENSLADYCRNISEPGVINVSFAALHTEAMQLTEEQTFHIFRIVQELLQNVMKHAMSASTIVQISYNAGRLYITVEDDGKGFDMEAAKKTNGAGLKNIEARVKILKGRIDYKTTKGTSVLIEIPCAEKK